MHARRIFALVVLVPFGLLTAQAVMEVGPSGILAHQFENSAGQQVFVDLVIALVLAFLWMIPDARKLGRNPWPWVVATFAVGSIAPLVYLLTSPEADLIAKD